MNLSFCGCGFLAVYHLGVAKALLQHGQGLLSQIQKVSGASAGALAGALLVIKPEAMERGRKFNFDLAASVRKKPAGAFTPNYNLLEPLEEFLRSEMPEDGYKRASGRLYLSLTDPIGWKNQMMSEYHSNEELLKCMIASCYIPVYAGLLFPEIRGKKYIDGGMTDNLYIFEKGRTVTVSAFSGPQDICPKDFEIQGKDKYLRVHVKNQDFQVNSLNLKRYRHALFPPDEKQMGQYHENGFTDAVRFLKREGFYDLARQIL